MYLELSLLCRAHHSGLAMSDKQEIDQGSLTDAQIMRMAERWNVDIAPNESRILNFARELMAAEAQRSAPTE